MKTETLLRRALVRLVNAAEDYAGENFFVCETREAKRMDAAVANAVKVLAETGRAPHGKDTSK
jgi:hypothetical protein